MTSYQRGRRAEYMARDMLLEQGYGLVIRSAASKGPIDLAAFGAESVKLVQVKSTVKARPNYADDIAVLQALEVPEYCQVELWIYLRTKRAWMICPA